MEEAKIGSNIEGLEKKIAKHESLGKGSSPELEQMVNGEKAILSSLKDDEGKAAKDEKGANSLTWWQRLLRFLKEALGKAKQGINKIKEGLSSVDPSGAIMAKAQAGDESFKEVGLNGWNAPDQLSANQKPHNKLRRGRRTLLHRRRSNIADGILPMQTQV